MPDRILIRAAQIVGKADHEQIMRDHLLFKLDRSVVRPDKKRSSSNHRKIFGIKKVPAIRRSAVAACASEREKIQPRTALNFLASERCRRAREVDRRQFLLNFLLSKSGKPHHEVASSGRQ